MTSVKSINFDWELKHQEHMQYIKISKKIQEGLIISSVTLKFFEWEYTV